MNLTLLNNETGLIETWGETTDSTPISDKAHEVTPEPISAPATIAEDTPYKFNLWYDTDCSMS